MLLKWITFVTILSTGLCASVSQCPGAGVNDRYHVKVLKDSCFKFQLTEKMDYEDAQEDCRKHGGHLAMAKDAETDNFLFKQLDDVFDYNGRVYIGLTDQEDEGEYIWEDGSDLDDGSYDNWADDKGPDRNAFGRKLKDCITIDTEEKGKWADDQCKKKKPYICQYKMAMAQEKHHHHHDAHVLEEKHHH